MSLEIAVYKTYFCIQQYDWNLNILIIELFSHILKLPIPYSCRASELVMQIRNY